MNIRVSFDELHAQATRLEAGREQITQVLGQLQSQIQQLVQSGYVTDRSSVAYRSAYEQFNHGAVQTLSGLEGLAHYLHQAAATLAEVDQQLAARLAG